MNTGAAVGSAGLGSLMSPWGRYCGPGSGARCRSPRRADRCGPDVPNDGDGKLPSPIGQSARHANLTRRALQSKNRLCLDLKRETGTRARAYGREKVISKGSEREHDGHQLHMMRVAVKRSQKDSRL